MQIWVDADACPNVIKEVLFRAAQRVSIQLLLVANKPLRVPLSPFIRRIQVAGGFDVADNYIVEHIQVCDVLVTADIPLAAAALARGAYVLSFRGEVFNADTIGERLVLRDLMETLRSGGIHTGGPAALSMGERQSFANQLDRLLVQHIKSTRTKHEP